MNKSKLSFCYYPTTTLLVDDNRDFLLKLYKVLTENDLLCRFYSNPLQALHYLNKEYKADPFTNRCIMTPADKEPESFISHFDVKKLHLEACNPQRFAQVSVCIFDQAMPAMTGSELCRQSEEAFSMKLILTAEVGAGFAVNAFNEGIIHQFLQKNSDLFDVLVHSVQALQRKYFLQLTGMAVSKGKQSLYEQAPLCLSDPVFVTFFQELCKKHRIVEYYLLDDHGSFLLLDADAVPSWLIAKPEEEMAGVWDFVECEGALEDIREGIKNRTLVPYFHTHEDWQVGYLDPECRDYVHPATALKGKHTTYYYSYVTKPDAYHLERDKVLSLNQYLENLSPAG